MRFYYFYFQMKFTGGQQCWNGPTRSATILLHCGTENKLTSVSEPNRWLNISCKIEGQNYGGHTYIYTLN